MAKFLFLRVVIKCRSPFTITRESFWPDTGNKPVMSPITIKQLLRKLAFIRRKIIRLVKIQKPHCSMICKSLSLLSLNHRKNIPSRKNSMSDPPSPEKKPRILIVDDMDINCDLLVFYLQQIASLDIAYTGEAAVIKAAQNSYDLILLDICLGSGIDGFEVLQEIRSQASNVDLPVIAITGSATEFERDDFLEKGFTEFLPKPVSKQELLNLIGKVLRKDAY